MKPRSNKLSTKKIAKVVENIHLAIVATFNNTIITAGEQATGNVLEWSSSGRVGFKGAKKGTPYAATMAMKTLLDKIVNYQPKTFSVTVAGAGNGRDAALRAIIGTNIKITKIKDVTPMPHNGCRPKKARRV